MSLNIQIITVILEYVILFCVCAFAYKNIHAIYLDIKDKVYNTEQITDGEGVLLILKSYNASLVGKKIEFSHELTIGRGEDNDVILNDAYVSHHHAIIMPVQNQYQIEDLHSRNSTYINARRINRAFLQDSDTIQIGKTTFQFHR